MINVFSNEEVAAEPGLNILRQSVGLLKFLGNCVLAKLNQVIYFILECNHYVRFTLFFNKMMI